VAVAVADLALLGNTGAMARPVVMAKAVPEEQGAMLVWLVNAPAALQKAAQIVALAVATRLVDMVGMADQAAAVKAERVAVISTLKRPIRVMTQGKTVKTVNQAWLHWWQVNVQLRIH
jgi:hypothetical protein